NALKPLEYHVELGARLASLRDQGVLIVGSGNIVHNLCRLRWDEPDQGFDWARRFDEAVVAQMAEQPGDILKLAEHPDFAMAAPPGAILKLAEHAAFAMAAPTPDHFVPVRDTAGLAAAGEGAAWRIVRGFAMGSLSMTCFGVGVDPKDCERAPDAALLPPDV